MAFSELPQELVDKIVAEFRGDVTNLCACALVSHAFLPCSRIHLFSSVRLTPQNDYTFRALLEFSPGVASYVRRLNMPLVALLTGSAFLPPESVAQLPNLSYLEVHCDSFDWCRLSATQLLELAGATHGLTTVHVVFARIWGLPLWATFLNGCAQLRELALHAEPSGWSVWTAAEIAALQMPRGASDAPLLHTLDVSGDCRILAPLCAWLVPYGYLNALHTLSINVLYVPNALDMRPPIVLAAGSSLQVLTLHLDPRMPPTDFLRAVSLADFPLLHELHLKDDQEANIAQSLEWLCDFLQTPTRAQSALTHISFEHSIMRHDLAEIPAARWVQLDAALLVPSFRMLTFKVYERSSPVMYPLAVFSADVRERLPGLHAQGRLEALQSPLMVDI